MPAPSACLALTALVCLTGSLSAQVAPQHDSVPLRVDVNLVLVPVTVTDRHGKIITGLDESRFQVLEEGVPQPIASFSTEDLPVSVGLVLDVSGSMKAKLAAARAFVSELLKGAESDDEAFFLTCADRPDVQSGLTRDLTRFDPILQSTHAEGWTALVDSIYLSADRLRKARNARKVLVIVSDGQDNHSRYSKSELRSKLVESEAQVYAVAMREPVANRKAIEMSEEQRGLAFLADIAQASGGLYFPIDSPDSIPRIAEQITQTLHHQYLIGYYPPVSGRNGRRRIQVRINPPELRLYARSSYFVSP